MGDEHAGVGHSLSFLGILHPEKGKNELYCFCYGHPQNVTFGRAMYLT